MPHRSTVSEAIPLIDTLLQRGVIKGRDSFNRFSGFQFKAETVETVLQHHVIHHTPLKRGVNENWKAQCADFKVILPSL